MLEAAPLYGEEVKVRTWHCRVQEHYLQLGGSSGTGLDLESMFAVPFLEFCAFPAIKSGEL